ncbi:MAG: GIY-YIG nuclease family protein [Gemmatimonadaceae bacterium]|nr:GIY-YIG nuclease family protein [Gemmatimonadaceae bacterium]
MSPRRRRRRGPLAPPKDVEMRIDNLLAVVKDTARNVPGVYRMTSAEGEVIYVGKAKALRTRLLSYFRAQYPKDKGARILREAATVTWEQQPSEFAALLRELRLIKQLKPRYNVAMKRDARYHAFVRISRGPAPRLQVVRAAGQDEHGTYYGPFRGALQLGDAIRELNDALGLRDCALGTPMFFADQVEFPNVAPRTPGCIRHEIGRCLGPCVAAVKEREYDAAFAAARAFLEGADDAPMHLLRGRMESASDSLDFERAAFWRDKLQRLEGLREQFVRLRFALESLSFTYDLPGVDGNDRTYIVRRGCIRDELPTPRDAAGRALLARRIAELTRGGRFVERTVPGHEVDEVLLVAGWFRKFPKELDRTTPFPTQAVAGQSA